VGWEDFKVWSSGSAWEREGDAICGLRLGIRAGGIRSAALNWRWVVALICEGEE